MKSFYKYFCESVKNNRFIYPTVEWMKKNFDKFNKKLFNNELPECEFKVFTTGKGSQGKYLGFFGYDDENVFVEENTRRLCKNFGNKKLCANKKNFAKFCRPYIELNGNFIAPEESWLNTLIHEMIHLWNVKDGIEPSTYHGKEFQEGCKIVSEKSNGKFNIDRLTDSEKIGFVLDKSIKLKKLKRQKTIDSKKKAVFIFFENGGGQFFITSSQKLVDGIIDFIRENELQENKVEKIIVSNDDWLIRDLKKLGYNMDIRKYQFWGLPEEKEDIVFDGYDYKTIFSR